MTPEEYGEELAFLERKASRLRKHCPDSREYANICAAREKLIIENEPGDRTISRPVQERSLHAFGVII